MRETMWYVAVVHQGRSKKRKCGMPRTGTVRTALVYRVAVLSAFSPQPGNDSQRETRSMCCTVTDDGQAQVGSS